MTLTHGIYMHPKAKVASCKKVHAVKRRPILSEGENYSSSKVTIDPSSNVEAVLKCVNKTIKH